MATRAIVPRADNEGSIGTTLKNWATGFIKILNGITVTGGSNTFNLTNGTASLDVAAGAAVNIDNGLTVNGGNAGTLTFSAANKTLTVPLDASVSGTNTGDTSIPYASAAEILAGTEAAKAIAPDQLKAANIRFPMGYGYMPPLTHGADTEHDIVIPACKWRDATDAVDMALASALTKQADAAWAVGTDAGGMDTGTIPASGTLHVWLIKRSGTGVVDALFSISATAPTMPANYDYKRLIGSYRTDATNNIINGDWWGAGLLRTFMFDTPILDVSNATPGTAAVTAALSTPGGIIVRSILNVAQVDTVGPGHY